MFLYDRLFELINLVCNDVHITESYQTLFLSDIEFQWDPPPKQNIVFNLIPPLSASTRPTLRPCTISSVLNRCISTQPWRWWIKMRASGNFFEFLHGITMMVPVGAVDAVTDATSYFIVNAVLCHKIYCHNFRFASQGVQFGAVLFDSLPLMSAGRTPTRPSSIFTHSP